MQPSGVRNLRLPLREDDRGAAGLRSDMPHRARRRVAENSDRKGYGNGIRNVALPPEVSRPISHSKLVVTMGISKERFHGIAFPHAEFLDVLGTGKVLAGAVGINVQAVSFVTVSTPVESAEAAVDAQQGHASTGTPIRSYRTGGHLDRNCFKSSLIAAPRPYGREKWASLYGQICP
ncbi:hypothetical protein QE432_001944 [Agrobacterium sp. SORGH_AS 745]|nr:hypothetical protein [Agrobacterium tumefaciens]MDQ1220363.1 hypothetical protein [Agrobacterium sp. SORGH_AS_0745]